MNIIYIFPVAPFYFIYLFVYVFNCLCYYSCPRILLPVFTFTKLTAARWGVGQGEWMRDDEGINQRTFMHSHGHKH